MTRWERLTPLTGVATVALWIVGLLLMNHANPSQHATDVQILGWYRSDTNRILTGGWLFMLGCILFIWFAAELRSRLLAANAGGTAVTVAFTGAVAAAIFGLATPAADVDGAVNKNDISAATAGTLHHLPVSFFVGAELATILLLVGVAAVSFRTGAFPKWWAWLMLVVSVVLLIGPIGWLGLIIGLPVWTLGTAAMMLRGDRRSAPAVSA